MTYMNTKVPARTNPFYRMSYRAQVYSIVGKMWSAYCLRHNSNRELEFLVYDLTTIVYDAVCERFNDHYYRNILWSYYL